MTGSHSLLGVNDWESLAPRSEKTTDDVLYVGMLDVQNFFHEALAVIISKLQYLYTRRKLSVSSIERYHFPVARPMCA